MMHMQMVVPAERTDAVVEFLLADQTVANVAVFPRAALRPGGSVVVCDVAREGAHAVVARLRELGIARDGSIMLSNVGTLLSSGAERAERAAPGHPDDGLVWDVVEDQVRRDSYMSFAYLAFLLLAVLLAGAGRLLDQPILIVGAMVVGPEFSPVAAICVALARPRLDMLPRALRTLVLGYAIAIFAAIPFWWLVHVLGHASRSDVATGNLTSFIVQPNGWSFVIALFAGVAGTIALTTAKSGPLVGVFISVTTVPAAGTVALCIGAGVWHEVLPALTQLVVNLSGMILAGTSTLLVQRTFWRRVGARATQLHG
jgi:uncharacterized hydrophobic protein (TIGR00271 family)